jgi:hypothetical protein
MSTKKIIVTGLAINAVIHAGSITGAILLKEPLEKILLTSPVQQSPKSCP